MIHEGRPKADELNQYIANRLYNQPISQSSINQSSQQASEQAACWFVSCKMRYRMICCANDISERLLYKLRNTLSPARLQSNRVRFLSSKMKANL